MNIYAYAEGANSDKSYIQSNSGVQLPVYIEYIDSSNKQLPIIIRVVKSNNNVAYILTTTATSNISNQALLKVDGVSRYYQPVLYAIDAKVYVMNFIGTSTTDPVGESGATVEGHETFEAGDVCLFGNKEYVYNKATSTWVELGDEGSHLTKTEAESTYLKKTDASTTYATKNELSSAQTTLQGNIDKKANQTDLTTLSNKVNGLYGDTIKMAEGQDMTIAGKIDQVEGLIHNINTVTNPEGSNVVTSVA